MVAAEEPLQLLLDGEPLSVIMRTPGNDIELALGLLWSERVIRALPDVDCVRISAEAGEKDDRVRVLPELYESNQVDVHLGGSAGRRPQRSFLASSACGVCGATTVESLSLDFPAVAEGHPVTAAVLGQLPATLREGQALFDLTGGLHAAAAVDESGRVAAVREDVGRHNAVDKVVGRLLLDGRLPASDLLLAVSGRAGYEVVQKAVAAGFPVVAAVGAPSSLAVATAERFGVTLIGFLRANRFNVYSAPSRVVS